MSPLSQSLPVNPKPLVLLGNYTVLERPLQILVTFPVMRRIATRACRTSQSAAVSSMTTRAFQYLLKLWASGLFRIAPVHGTTKSAANKQKTANRPEHRHEHMQMCLVQMQMRKIPQIAYHPRKQPCVNQICLAFGEQTCNCENRTAKAIASERGQPALRLGR